MEIIYRFIRDNYRLVIVAGIMLMGFIFWITGIGQSPTKNSGESYFNKTREENNQTAEESTQSENFTPLRVTKTDPFFNSIETLNSNVPITLYFSENINIDSLKLVINPQVETRVELGKLGESVVVIYPKIPWVYGVKYTITVTEATAKNNNQNKLTTPFQYNITVIKGKPPAHD
jgi:hypothetical protein